MQPWGPDDLTDLDKTTVLPYKDDPLDYQPKQSQC